jgi:hypothetical protein
MKQNNNSTPSSSSNIDTEVQKPEVPQTESLTPDSIRGALIDLIDNPPCP